MPTYTRNQHEHHGPYLSVNVAEAFSAILRLGSHSQDRCAVSFGVGNQTDDTCHMDSYGRFMRFPTRAAVPVAPKAIESATIDKDVATLKAVQLKQQQAGWRCAGVGSPTAYDRQVEHLKSIFQEIDRANVNEVSFQAVRETTSRAEDVTVNHVQTRANHRRITNRSSWWQR